MAEPLRASVTTEHPDHDAEGQVIYVDPIIIVGLIGNIIILVLMQKRSLRRYPIAVLLSALAVADSLVLILYFLNDWLRFAYDTYLLGNEHFCIFHHYMSSVCYSYAGWLVAALVMERTISICAPSFAEKRQLGRPCAIVAVCVLPVPLLNIYLNHVFGWKINQDGICDIDPDIEHFQIRISPWITAALYCYLPNVIFIVCVSLIICHYCRCCGSNKIVLEPEDGIKSEPKDGRVIPTFTFMVIVIGAVHFVLTIPVTTWYIIIFASGKYIEQTLDKRLTEAVILHFALLNHAAKFFLYLIFSRTFRQELFCCKRKNDDDEDGELNSQAKN